MARQGSFQGPTGPYERALSSVHPIDNNMGAVASTPVSPTGGSGGGSTGGTGDPATTAPAPAPTPKTDYSTQIAVLKLYIARLSAVKTPTTTQKTELQTYIARLADYLNR